MKLLLPIVAVLGFASLPLWPDSMRLALGLGWGFSLAAEALLARRRHASLTEAGSMSMLLVIVLGFLGRLSLLALGAIVGSMSGLFPEGPFLGAFLGGMFAGEALTLPGLAGLVLTVGMAVDANILVFERIKEERAKGRTLAQAVTTGYDRALITIIDSNLTTLITAYMLFQIGSGPVRGFR